jgi:hypothetical protein
MSFLGNVQTTKVLFKRGNTQQNSNYLGVLGEVSVDTEAKSLRIHDGVIRGGYPLSGAGGGISTVTSATPPASPGANQLWYDPISGRMFLWYNDGNSSQWVSV